MKKSIAFILLSATMLLMLAGCGGFGEYGGNNYQSNYAPNSNQSLNIPQQTEAPTTVAALVNSDYQEIFTSRYIVDVDTVFFMLDSSSFATADADGMVEKLQFGYEDDVIMEMVDTLYYPVVGMTDSEKLALEQAIKEYFADLEAQSFCTASYDMGASWYRIEFHLTDIDNVANHGILVQYGMLASADNNPISMSKTETDLLANGYVKK